MKRFFAILLIIICLGVSESYAYSSGFLYMVNAMKIPTTNVNGLNINEEIYEKYNLFVYGNPTLVKDPKQNWKNSSTGKMTRSGSVWNGVGERGEYWILGEDVNGKSVHNEIFPDDYNSGISPTEWIYREVVGAEESWNDASKFIYEEQKEYMLTQKLSRFGTVYDLTASDIGTNKTRVENFATWSSAGSIYTEKPGVGNGYWVATFSVPPMAGNAKLNSVLEFPNGLEYTIPKEESKVVIPIEFGAFIDGLSSYARDNHVKTIESELKINGNLHSVISSTETTRIGKNTSLIVDKVKCQGMDKIVFEVECNSYASTYFNDGKGLYATQKKTVIVNLDNDKISYVDRINEEHAPTIYSVKIKRLTKERGITEYVDLYTNKRTQMPFVCAGQVIRIEVETSSDAEGVTFDFSGYESIKKLDQITERFLWDEPNERKEATAFRRKNALDKYYDLPDFLVQSKETLNRKVFCGTYIIPYGTKQTLHSWNSLRESSKDAFKIDESRLFTRKDRAYELVVSAKSLRFERTKSYSFDVAERWDELYNHDLTKYISNR